MKTSTTSARFINSLAPPTPKPVSGDDGIYNRYRRGFSLDLKEDLVEESRQTFQHIRSVTPTGLYLQVLHEIGSAAAANEQANRMEKSPGPSGRFLYEWIVPNAENGDLNKRIYQRTLVDDPTRVPAVVLEEMNWQTTDLLDMSLSADESMIAYLISNGSGQSVLWIRDIITGRQIRPLVSQKENMVAVEFGAKTNGSHALFVVATDSLGRPDRVFSTALAPASLRGAHSPAALMRMVYQSIDPTVHVDLHRTKGCEFVAINARTQSSNEVYLIKQHNDTLQLVRKREIKVQYHVDVGTDRDVFLLANRQSTENTIQNEADELSIEPSLFQSSTNDLPLQGGSWGTSLPGSFTKNDPSHSIFEFDIFHKFVVFYERSTIDGVPRIRVLSRKNDEVAWSVPVSSDDCEFVGTLRPAGNMHYHANSCRFHVDCPSVPRMTCKYNMVTKQRTLLTQTAAISFPPDLVQRRIFVSSHDGTRVPLSLVHHKDVVDDQHKTKPVNVVLIGYGAYGEPVNLACDPMLQVLLARGFVVAFAHTRGGGELGRAWHLRGRGREKVRAVEDYLACAEALISGTVWNRSVHLTAKGFSAGGILIGAAVNQRPDLFRKVVLTNAFLDLDATMRNTSLHLTQHEWDEYGNPLQDENASRSIAAICPFLNVSDIIQYSIQFLLIGTLDDERVPFWNAVVYGKKIRLKCCGKANVFIHIEGEGGHHLENNKVRVAAIEATFIAANDL